MDDERIYMDAEDAALLNSTTPLPLPPSRDKSSVRMDIKVQKDNADWHVSMEVDSYGTPTGIIIEVATSVAQSTQSLIYGDS